MDDAEGRRDLDDAATVHSARREIDDAIAELAASPLDEHAADRMRAALAAPRLRTARSALSRLSVATVTAPRRPRLSVVVADLDLPETGSGRTRSGRTEVAPPGDGPSDEEPDRAPAPGVVREAQVVGGAA